MKDLRTLEIDIDSRLEDWNDFLDLSDPTKFGIISGTRYSVWNSY